MNGAQTLCESLRHYGVSFLVGIPGTDNTDVYDVCETYGIRPIVVRNEMFAPMFADGYARVSRKTGVVFSIPGPGALALMSGLLEAYGSSTPMLAIVTDIPQEFLSKETGHLHEVSELASCFRSVTSRRSSVTCANVIPRAMHMVMEHAVGERKRPSLLHIPTDVYRDMRTEDDFHPTPARPTPKADVSRAVEMIAMAKRPIIFAGNGVWWADAMEPLRTLAERMLAPVFTSVKGKGIISDHHWCGYGQLAGEPEFRECIAESDLAIIVGMRWSQRSTDRWTLKLPENVIRIDCDVETRKHPRGEYICADAHTALTAIVQALPLSKVESGRWRARFMLCKSKAIERIRTESPFEMGLISALRAAIPENAIVVNDSTIMTFWTRRYFEVTNPGTFLWPMGSGTIGWALPAALGAKLAVQRNGTNRPVVAIVGDGGFQFSMQELGTMVQEKLPVVIVLFDDSAYGMIRYFQHTRYGKETHATNLHNPYFGDIARAYGMLYHHATSPEAVECAIRDSLSNGGPALVHCPMQLNPPRRL